MAKKRSDLTPWARKLKLLRERRELSQADAARLLDVPIATYRGWEQGRHTPPPYVQRLVMKVFNKD